MSAVIFNHPRHEVKLQKDYLDPREQTVEPEDYRLPIPGHTSPITLALTGQVAPDTCAACSEPIGMHYDTTGLFPIGCEGAVRRRELGLVQNRALGGIDLNIRDGHPAVTRMMLNCLFVGFEEWSEQFAAMDTDRRLRIARQLAQRAVWAYLEEEAARLAQ